jgi:hypothetical protein
MRAAPVAGSPMTLSLIHQFFAATGIVALGMCALLFGVCSQVSSLLLAFSTYRVARDGDWEATRIGLVLTGACIVLTARLTSIFF